MKTSAVRPRRADVRRRLAEAKRKRLFGRVNRLGLAVGVVAATSVVPVAAGIAAPSVTVDGCLGRPGSQQTVLGSTSMSSQYREASVPDQHTFDFRGTRFLGDQDTAQSPDNTNPVVLGTSGPGADTCVIGGYIKGTHDRDLDWEYLKHDPGGGDRPAIKPAGTGTTLIDGLRVDNMMNGIRPHSDGVVLRNAYFNYIRDDCVANDSLHDMRIVDSLFDGCFVGFSARPESGSSLWNQGRDSSVLELDRVLVRMKRMPGGFKLFDPAPGVETFGHVFKWSDVAGPVVVRDSVFMVEHPGKDDINDLDWPSNVTAQNVTVVWDGEGSYPGRLPSGVTVTKDVTVWERARADWLSRHGCSDIDHCDVAQLTAPGGTSEPVPAPEEPTTTEPTTDPTPTQPSDEPTQEPTAPEPTTDPTPTQPSDEPTQEPPTDDAPAPAADAPPVLSAEVTADGVQLRWTATAGAEKYRVFWSATPNRRFERIAVVRPGEPLEFLDGEDRRGGQQYYRVAAVIPDADNLKSEVVSVQR